MGNKNLHGDEEMDYTRDDDLFYNVPENGTSDPFSDIVQSILSQDKEALRLLGEDEEPEENDVEFSSPDEAFDVNEAELNDYETLDTYNDSGEYRSFDGNREYRSFDASLPDASPEEWYHFSDEDLELDGDDGEDDFDQYDYEPRRQHRGLKIFAHAVLVLLTAFSIVYLFALYTDNAFVSKMRTMYIQTAMSTLNHKWMATAIIPGDIIDDVMRLQYEAENALIGIETEWGDINIETLPSFESETITANSSMESETVVSSEPEEVEESPYEDSDEETFFDLFWEIDYDSMQNYVADHPDVLEDGWAGIDINESGLEDEGTDITTIYGDQVLAINAAEGITLIRVEFPGSRGVMAICKDTSRLSLCAADTLGVIGQTVGRICEANDGILGITGSAFIDPEGAGNGGELSGMMVCSGETYGSPLGDSYKRLELRDDNKMYIVDSYSDLGDGTRDACEFMPAVIIDGEIMSSNWNSPNPRAILGQSSRLETMMVVAEGRLIDSPGCGVEDIAEVMQQYGCVQAMNLDGGTSAIMYYKGETITRCSNQNLPDGRTLPSAWVYHYAE